MENNITTLERTFQLAGSGECASVPEIKKRLKAEGYSTAPVIGGTLLKQLAALIKASRG
jgi:hypothetical protein